VFYGDASISIGAGGEIEIVAPGGLTINGAVVQSGGDMASNGVVVATHIHTKVQAGAAKSGPPDS
jgi:phage baseplate assembly protein gpV